jgi:lysozyme
MDIFEQLRRDESVRSKPYLDCCGKYWRECTCANKGKLTIGVGRNLDDVGLSDAEINYLEGNDVTKVTSALHSQMSWVDSLNEARFGVLQNMAFNMGVGGLKGFPKMLDKLQAGDFEGAAAEMVDSAWYRQVGGRAKQLVTQIETGEWV